MVEFKMYGDNLGKRFFTFNAYNIFQHYPSFECGMKRHLTHDDVYEYKKKNYQKRIHNFFFIPLFA